MNLYSPMYLYYYAIVSLTNHFNKTLNDTEQLVEKTRMIPLEVVVRNLATGSVVERLGFNERTVFHPELIELYYKNDHLDDPIINDQHALLLANITQSELEIGRASCRERVEI